MKPGNTTRGFIRNTSWLFPAVILASLCWTVVAGETQAQDVRAKITKEEASQNALQKVPGKITDVTIERKLGKDVYVVEVVAEKDGEETDVLVDMDSGKVLGIER